MLCYTIMIIEVKSRETVSDFLQRTGRRTAVGCSLHKGCGKCQIKLLSGVWESDGKILFPPASAAACVTKLKSTIGTIEIPDEIPVLPQTFEEWSSPRPLPSSDAPVIAVDIGTTTLAAVRIEKGKICQHVSSFNGQCVCGDNIISRIALGEKEYPRLQRLLTDSVGALLEELDRKSVKCIGIAGNTVMSCFLHGISPAVTGVYPFKAAQKIFPERRDLWGNTPVFTLPALTGLIGGDLTGALYEHPLEEGEMLLDLGTNCEILFAAGEGLIGTSAAAGPAFEGAGISSGSRAVPGAIEHYEGPGRFRVIGGVPPRSICGSGLTDLLARSRAAGLLSSSGRFTVPQKHLELAEGVTVTEEDIAELLKAKAAVASAVKALEQYSRTPVRKLKLAGGFARSLDLNAARQIGLLPDVETECCGNLSLAGAARAALEPEALEEMAHLAEKIREVHLNELPGYEDLFTASLRLP